MINKEHKNEKTPIEEENEEKEIKLPGKSHSLKVELETGKLNNTEIEPDLKDEEKK